MQTPMIDQVSRGLDHPAGAARGTKTTPFARKRYEVLMQTAIVLDAQEPVLEPAARKARPNQSLVGLGKFHEPVWTTN